MTFPTRRRHAGGHQRHRRRGFTLIEVVVATAVIAILSKLALQSYAGYVQRAHRGHAKAAVLRVAQFAERAATAGGTYPATVPQALRAVEGGRYDDVTYTPSADRATFTITVTRKPGTPQATDTCGDFRIDHVGTRTTVNAGTGVDATACWAR